MKDRIHPNVVVNVVERKTLPVLTGLLSFLIVYVYYCYQSSHGASWLITNTFQAEQIVDLFNTRKFAQLCGVIFNTNFANNNVWQMLISVYFVYLFGIPVEKRLGPARFLTLIFLACTIPWIVQIVDLIVCPLWRVPFEQVKYTNNFFGPYALILALASAYVVLVPKKSKDRTNSRYYIKDKTEIFNRSHGQSMNERFGFSPDFFFTVSLLYVFIARYVVLYFYKNDETIGLYAGLSALMIGYILASFIHMDLEENYQEHPLKHAAIKHYYELLDLDVGHENAVKGAAKGLGLPDYQVEGWVKKSKGKLRPT